MKSKHNFRGFITCYNNKHERFGTTTEKFKALQTFINWFFAWASRMRIDFRKGCFWWKGSARILACDGTKIGIGFRNTFVAPIEYAEKIAPPNSSHLRRLDCCFLNPHNNISSEECKVYANASKVLGNITDAVITEKLPEILPVTVRDLKSFLPEECVNACEKMTDLGNTNKREIKVYASVFYLLSYDASVDAIIPLCIRDDTLSFLETCATVQCTSTVLTDFAEKLNCFSSEFSRLLLCTANDYSPSNAVLKLLRYCVKFVIKCHKSDILPEKPSPIQGTYNPPKLGRAYYFSDHGC